MPDCETCGRKDCREDNKPEPSHYIEIKGCGLFLIRDAWPNIRPSQCEPWTDFSFNVLNDLYSELLTEPLPVSFPDVLHLPRGSGRPSEFFPTVLSVCRILGSVLRSYTAVGRPDLKHLKVVPSNRILYKGDGRGEPRGPDPDLFVAARPISRKPPVMLLVAGSVAEPVAFSSYEAFPPHGDPPPRPEHLDAINHLSLICLASDTRYAFILTPYELVILRFCFAVDDPGSGDWPSRSMHVQWISVPWSPTYPNKHSLTIQFSLVCLGLLSLSDEERPVPTWDRRGRINTWRKLPDGRFMSCVSGRIVQEAPATAVFT